MSEKNKLTAELLISDEELDKVFEGTKFGSVGNREMLNKTVKKVGEGYYTGFTIKCIMIELGLQERLQHEQKLTPFGEKYLTTLKTK